MIGRNWRILGPTFVVGSVLALAGLGLVRASAHEAHGAVRDLAEDPAGALVHGSLLAHGSLEVPISRAYRCYREGPERPISAACREALLVAGPQQFYDWNELNLLNADGRHRELIPDGELCSAGREKFRGLDLPRADWPTQAISPDARGEFEFVYRATAPHSTQSFTFYLTKDDYDPTRPLQWDNLSDEPFCKITEPTLRNQRYHLRCPAPPDASGRHVIYSIWERDDSPEAFYACSDVLIGAPGPESAAPLPQQDTGEAPEGECASGDAWHPGYTYLGGDRVTHNRQVWEARWWTRGERPRPGEEWDVWEAIGSCEADADLLDL